MPRSWNVDIRSAQRATQRCCAVTEPDGSQQLQYAAPCSPNEPTQVVLQRSQPRTTRKPSSSPKRATTRSRRATENVCLSPFILTLIVGALSPINAWRSAETTVAFGITFPSRRDARPTALWVRRAPIKSWLRSQALKGRGNPLRSALFESDERLRRSGSGYRGHSRRRNRNVLLLQVVFSNTLDICAGLFECSLEGRLIRIQ